MVFPWRSLLAGTALLACSSPDGSAPHAPATDARAITIEAVGDGASLTVSAIVLDERGLASTLAPGELFSARIGSEDYVLTLTGDSLGDPIYRVSVPALLHYVDIDVQLGRRGGRSEWLAEVRVDEPFRIARTPERIQIGEELRIEFATTSASPSGRATIAFEGTCLRPTTPAPLQLYGSMSEARFDTTNLPVNGGGCDVTVTVMMTHDANVSLQARGIQQRSFVIRFEA